MPFLMLTYLLFDLALPENQPAGAAQTTPVYDLLRFLPIGYLLSVAIELPILYFFLPSRISKALRIFAGFWLTACSYPFVGLIFPLIFFGYSRAVYLLAAETFAPVAECLIFWLAIAGKINLSSKDLFVSFAIITLANLCSFAIGEVFNAFGWFGYF
jgi:hypothetical protein